MRGLYEQIKVLFDEQLYSNVVIMATMVITTSENNFNQHITPHEIYQTYCYYADSLYQLKQYRKAEFIYKKALHLRKSVLKPRSSSKPDANKDLQSEIDIKYKLYLCYVEMNQTQESIEILQSIPPRQRTVKINIGLGKAYDRGGVPRQAIAAYKEALKVCPLALEVAERLLTLKVPANAVIDLMTNGTIKAQELPKDARQRMLDVLSDNHSLNTSGGIVAAWINAVALAKTGDWPVASKALRALDSPGAPLRGCSSILITLGEVYYYAGEHKLAIGAFQRAHSLDPYMLRGLEAYAACLSRENWLRDRIDALVPASLPSSEYTLHHWLTLAHLHIDKRRLPPAAYLAQKACYVEPRNPEALLLKGTILMSMKKYAEALDHFRESMDVAPDRYESYVGMAEANMALRRSRQAISICTDCCKKFNQSPRALTLYANILLKEGEPDAHAKAREILEKALVLENPYLPAALALAQLIDSDTESHQAIKLLENLAMKHPSSSLHLALGDVWVRRGEPSRDEKAIQHYHTALALEPKNKRAQDALDRLGRTPTAQQGQPSGSTPANGDQEADNTYELIAEANVPSDNSNAPEESETEVVSDMDLEMS